MISTGLLARFIHKMQATIDDALSEVTVNHATDLAYQVPPSDLIIDPEQERLKHHESLSELNKDAIALCRQSPRLETLERGSYDTSSLSQPSSSPTSLANLRMASVMANRFAWTSGMTSVLTSHIDKKKSDGMYLSNRDSAMEEAAQEILAAYPESNVTKERVNYKLQHLAKGVSGHGRQKKLDFLLQVGSSALSNPATNASARIGERKSSQAGALTRSPPHSNGTLLETALERQHNKGSLNSRNDRATPRSPSTPTVSSLSNRPPEFETPEAVNSMDEAATERRGNLQHHNRLDLHFILAN